MCCLSSAATNAAISSASRCGLVERDEGPRVGDLDEARVRGLPPRGVPRTRSGRLVARCPGQQDRQLRVAQLLGRLQRVALVHPDGHLLGVALDAGVVQSRAHPGGDQLGRDRLLREGLEGARGRGRRSGTAPTSSVIPPGSFASGGIALKIPGGKFSWVSQLVRTRRPIRSGWRVTSTWDIAPPESLPTIVTSSRSRPRGSWR